ncbi:tetratricopeptide repeat protein [Plasmodium brasilianum]|uniref:Tetratricopeptide repeat protein n=1 Tax=Plasmodium brasilianum TaxID=5824 RepID=A0ACB9Y125_PLABR|nr:tetratricopeptide repeat protein [Plasmodium brasilianum]
MITDSEAPTYNFNSDDEAPCEYLNDCYAISEDTFSFKIIKQLGENYYSPGNGNKVKIIYYELGHEDKITTAQVYLGKNDKLPYICEIAAKCMKPKEVCIIQAPKSFKKIFKNSEKKSKYDKKDNFRVAFKKALRFKQKCVDQYSSFHTVRQFKKIKLNSIDIELLLKRKKQKKEANTENDQIRKETATNDKIETIPGMLPKKNDEKCKEKMQLEEMHEKSEFLTLDDINDVRYKFLKEEHLCTFIVYLKEFRRVDALNDDKTIIKEVIKEGKGIITPKKNDYIDFFIEEGKKREYIHTVFDVNNLKYRGLFKILQSMKKKEMSKVILKGLECFHIYYTVEDTSKNYVGNIGENGSDTPQQNKRNPIHFSNVNNNNSNNNKKNTCDNNSNTSRNNCNDYNGEVHETIVSGINGRGNLEITKRNDTFEKVNNTYNTIRGDLTNQRKEMLIEVVDFKKSKTINVTSIISMNHIEKMLFYVYEHDKKKNFNNKPIIDSECELIIYTSIRKDMDKKKNKKVYLPFHFCDNNENIKKSNAYFLFSYGSCFTTPFWFYECFKGLKEGDEIIIPLTKNKNIFSENQFIYHLLYEDIEHNNINDNSSNNPEFNQLNIGSPCINEKKQIDNSQNNECKIKDPKDNKNDLDEGNKIIIDQHSAMKSKRLNDQKNFVQFLIYSRNRGKGCFMINGLKKRHVNRFCEDFFSLQKLFIDRVNYKNEIVNMSVCCRSFEKIKRKKFYKRITNIHKKKRQLLTKTIRHKSKNFNESTSNDKYAIEKMRKRRKKTNHISYFKRALKNVYFDKSFYEKDAILKIKIVKIICKKKDPWNMNVSEQIENLNNYNEMGNTFIKKKLYYAASLQYKKGYDIFRFSEIYNLIFEEKKLKFSDLQKEDNVKELVQYMEKILTNLSICFYKLSNYNECVKYAEKAAIINPQNVKSIYWKHMAYLQQNKYAQVIQNLNNSFCLNNSILLKLYNNARIIKKKHDDNFNSLFYAMYDQK